MSHNHKIAEKIKKFKGQKISLKIDAVTLSAVYIGYLSSLIETKNPEILERSEEILREMEKDSPELVKILRSFTKEHLQEEE